MDPGDVLPSTGSGRSRETRIRRDALGRWFNDDVQVTHPRLTSAFDRWLRPAPDGSGRYCLSNSINWAYVQVEGPALFVRRVRLLPDGAVSVCASDGRWATLAPLTLREDREGRLYCDLHGMPARFESDALVQLASIVDADAEGVFLRIKGEIVRPRTVEDPLSALSAQEDPR